MEVVQLGPRFPFHGVSLSESRYQSSVSNVCWRRCLGVRAQSSSVQKQAQATPSRTQRIMESIPLSGEVGGAGGTYSYNALKRLDQLWTNICSAKSVMEEPKQVVFDYPGLFKDFETTSKEVEMFDVLVCGGTLGIFIATALSLKGLRVGIVERNQLKGREQEWNISKKELMELVETGVLTEDEIEQVTAVQFNPNRCGFEGKGEIWVEDILNLGVSPIKIIDVVKTRFQALGGVIFEGCSLSRVSIYDDTAVVHLSEGKILSGNLIIDAMGNFSPLVKQIRQGRKPDGFCLVVGSCGRGFEDNTTSDVIYSSSAMKKVGESKAHYFWEAFPAGSGPKDRTTYLFTYIDPQPGSPKLEELLEDYWDLMPNYQGVSLDDLEILRVAYGIFPTFRDSPLPSAFRRVLQVRNIYIHIHISSFLSRTVMPRRNEFWKIFICSLVMPAVFSPQFHLVVLEASPGILRGCHVPNLSSSWLFQRAMSARKESNVPSTFINELLYVNFQSMQDVIQFGPLVKTLGLVMLTKPQIIPSIFKQVGIPVLLDWSGHFFMLGSYTFLSTVVDPVVRPFINTFPAKGQYEWKRRLEAWQYGAGLDYKL
ncbi:unnamed protein product [Rhodiola kirilowii]